MTSIMTALAPYKWAHKCTWYVYCLISQSNLFCVHDTVWLTVLFYKNNIIMISRDSSVGEQTHLTVFPLCGLGHDSSVGEWMHLTVCPSCGPSSIPRNGGVFQGSFPWLITLCQPIPARASMAENGSISPQRDHTICEIEEKGQRPTTNRWWLRQKKIKKHNYGEILVFSVAFLTRISEMMRALLDRASCSCWHIELFSASSSPNTVMSWHSETPPVKSTRASTE